MCGIFGLLNIGRSGLDSIAILDAASEQMKDRGPDDEGFWSDKHSGLAFRRLSIIDLSPRGHQPMISDDKRHILVYNGELYNYLELKQELVRLGRHFRSDTDSEVVLQAIIQWGTGCISRFNGMFAFCLYDREEGSFTLARDHVGMKPLYVGFSPRGFVFGSQLNQVMLAFSHHELTIDPTGLAMFLAFGYYPAPRSVFKEIHQLEAGSWMKVYKDGRQERGRHFDLLNFYRDNQDQELKPEELASALQAAVRRHLMSDVPIATFLSGGLDSSIINAMTRRLTGNNFTAFTLSNPGSDLDEAQRASLIAGRLGIQQKIVYPVDIHQVIGQFAEAYQEPFGDYSALPALMVTGSARSHVKVMLSGDGSDEFFFGYNRMQSMLAGAPYYSLPLWIRKGIKRIRKDAPAITYNSLEGMVLERQSWAPEHVFQDLGVGKQGLANEFVGEFKNANLPTDMLIKLNAIHRYFQLQLLKLDRASMYNSIEARVPFADKEFMRHSVAYRARQVTSSNYVKRKLPLKSIFSSLFPGIPEEVGRKRGFTLDMPRLLSSELRPMVLDLLGQQSLFGSYVDFGRIRYDFERGKVFAPFFIWSLVSLQLWTTRHWHGAPKISLS